MSSLEFIERYEGAKSVFIGRNESKIDRVKKLTHLHLNGKRIDSIGDLSVCSLLKVLYLHNNGIRQIENLFKLTELTHLYLQWNKIERIDNLSTLKCLKTLFLGNNKIAKLENLEKLTRLEELHIERQRLNEGIEFTFDLGCLDLLSKNLRVLNISGLRLTNLDFLSTLQNLQELIAADNRFESPTEIGESIGNLYHLMKVEFSGCPAQKDTHYKEKIIAKAPKIITLDGKELLRNTRIFIQRLEDVKDLRKKNSNSVDTTPTKIMPNELSSTSLQLFSFDPDFYSLNESISYQSWNSYTILLTNSVHSTREALSNVERTPVDCLCLISVHPKNLSKKYAKQNNQFMVNRADAKSEDKAVELLRGKLFTTVRPKK